MYLYHVDAQGEQGACYHGAEKCLMVGHSHSRWFGVVQSPVALHYGAAFGLLASLETL
jgi:hypothetical protein